GRRGDANRFATDIDARPLVALGRLLIWPLRTRWRLSAFLLLLVVAGSALYAHRYAALLSLADAFGGYRWFFALVGCGLLTNLVSMAARAAAIQRYTPERVRAGIVLGFLWLPRFFVDSAGAAERASRIDRARIVGASVVGVGGLALLCVLVWFLSAQTQPTLASAAMAQLTIAVVGLFLTLNPLAQRDGYFLLAHWLNVPDLREQAVLALRGRERPWFTQRRKLPRWLLLGYLALMLAYVVLMVTVTVTFLGGWLSERLHGTGFLILMSVMGAFMYRQFSKMRSLRSNLGWQRNWMPSKRGWAIIAAAVLISLVPYRYEPSGEFVVLPQARADVRALVAGDVREVLVREGDLVEAGQVIVRLADDAQIAAVAAGEAKLAQLRADLQLARGGGKAEEIEVAKQRVVTARKREEVARATADRLEHAFRRRAVTVQEYERARGLADVAKQELIEAERGLDLVSSTSTAERIEAIEAQMREAEATLAYHRQQLEATRITAPIAGRIVSSRLLFAIGNYLNRGELLAVVEDSSQRLAEIKLPESGVGEIEVGAPAYAKVWAYPGTTFEGEVRSIAPAAEEGRYGNIVRVQVSIEDPEDRLKSGMTGNAKVRGRWHPLIVVFTRALARFLFIEVWSWLP
ncbi:MAG: HlyD family efflux transporter periplasmic adaptor subunit, partial [Pseudomonadota bacterium]